MINYVDLIVITTKKHKVVTNVLQILL